MLVQYGAGGALYPFLTPYLAARGFTVADISWVIVASAAATTVMPFVWGAIADHFVPVDRLVVALHFVAAGLLVAWSGAETLGTFIVLFAAYASFQQPTNSLVNALSFHHLDDPAQQFGRLRLWGSVGWMLPSVPIGLWLARLEDPSFDSVIWFAVAFHLAAAAGAPFWPHTPPLGRHRSFGSFFRDVRALLAQRDLLLLLAVAFFTLASFPLMFFFSSLALDRAGVPKPWLGPLLSIGVAFEVPLLWSLRAVLRRFGFRTVLGLGIVATILRHVIYAATRDAVSLVLASLLIAPSIVCFLIGTSLAVDRLAPRGLRASAQALYTLAGAGFGSVVGLVTCALLSGYSDDVDDLARPFVLGAGFSTVGFLLLTRVRFGGASRV